MVRYYGYYSNVMRGERKKAGTDDTMPCILESELTDQDFLRNWARLRSGFVELSSVRRGWVRQLGNARRASNIISGHAPAAGL